MTYPHIVSRDEWLVARAELLTREKKPPMRATGSTPHGATCRWSRWTRRTASRGQTAR